MNANDLMRRLRAGEISYSDFFKESEKLSLEELQSLTSLLIEWTKSSAAQRGNLPKKD